MASLAFPPLGPDLGPDAAAQRDEEPDEQARKQDENNVAPLPISSNTAPPSLINPGEPAIALAKGEILAFRVGIQVASANDKTWKYKYKTSVIHQGQANASRHITNATRDIDFSETNRSNDKAANAYLSFVQRETDATTVSSPVCAFMKLLEEHVREDKTLKIILKNAYEEGKKVWHTQTNALKERKSQLRSILDAATFDYFYPLVERMRKYVGADKFETWTDSVLEKLNAGQTTPLLVKYYFSNLAQKKYLDVYNEVQRLTNELKELGAFDKKRKRKQPTALSRLFKDVSLKQSVQSKQTKKSNGGAQDFDAIVKSMVETHERGGANNKPPTENQWMRSVTDELKQLVLKKTLKLEVVPAQEPHFHLCFDFPYFFDRVQNQKRPDVVKALKVVHTRRYRAMNVHADREKVYERRPANVKTSDEIVNDVRAELKGMSADESYLRQRQRDGVEMEFHNKFVDSARKKQRRLRKKLGKLQMDQKKDLDAGPVSAGESKKKDG